MSNGSTTIKLSAQGGLLTIYTGKSIFTNIWLYEAQWKRKIALKRVQIIKWVHVIRHTSFIWFCTMYRCWTETLSFSRTMLGWSWIPFWATREYSKHWLNSPSPGLCRTWSHHNQSKDPFWWIHQSHSLSITLRRLWRSSPQPSRNETSSQQTPELPTFCVKGLLKLKKYELFFV